METQIEKDMKGRENICSHELAVCMACQECRPDESDLQMPKREAGTLRENSGTWIGR